MNSIKDGIGTQSSMRPVECETNLTQLLALSNGSIKWVTISESRCNLSRCQEHS